MPDAPKPADPNPAPHPVPPVTPGPATPIPPITPATAPVSPPAIHPGQPLETAPTVPSPPAPSNPVPAPAPAPAAPADPNAKPTDAHGSDFVKVRWKNKIGGHEKDGEWCEIRRAQSLAASGHVEIMKDEDEKKK